jgi:hypothetical protein
MYPPPHRTYDRNFIITHIHLGSDDDDDDDNESMTCILLLIGRMTCILLFIGRMTCILFLLGEGVLSVTAESTRPFL